MNCNIYINDELYKKLENYRKFNHKSRNGIITEALSYWLSIDKNKHWPKSFFTVKESMKNIYPDISELRKDALPPKEVKF